MESISFVLLKPTPRVSIGFPYPIAKRTNRQCSNQSGVFFFILRRNTNSWQQVMAWQYYGACGCISHFRSKDVFPDRKFHGANMRPSWADRTRVGPLSAPWTLLSGLFAVWDIISFVTQFIEDKSERTLIAGRPCAMDARSSFSLKYSILNFHSGSKNTEYWLCT